MDLVLDVIAGRLAAVQDLGRFQSRSGLSTNGALDQFAARAANAMVGNAAREPLIEMLLVGAELVPSREALIAVTGAEADLSIDGRAMPRWQPVVVPAGARVRVSGIRSGNLAYLAVAGTWEVPRFGGSVAADAGVGFSNALDDGRRIRVRDAPQHLVNPWLGVPLLRVPALAPRTDAVLDVLPGPDLDAVDGLREALTGQSFAVDTRSNHVGVRLTGDLPSGRPAEEILSHGVAIGAVELPPSDELIVLQRGRSLTAGYPIVAVVSRVSQDVLAQLQPGERCRMRWRDAAACIDDARRQRRSLESTTAAVRSALTGLAAPVAAAS